MSCSLSLSNIIRRVPNQTRGLRINGEVEAEGKHGGDRRSEKEQVDNVNLKLSKGGNAPTYALRRLKRDRPDLAKKVVEGKLSAHAATLAIRYSHRYIAGGRYPLRVLLLRFA